MAPKVNLTPEAERPQTVSSIESLPRYTSSELSTEEAVVDQWWRVIGDAEVNTLVDELRVESFTLKETRLQIEQAQELAAQARAFVFPRLTVQRMCQVADRERQVVRLTSVMLMAWVFPLTLAPTSLVVSGQLNAQHY